MKLNNKEIKINEFSFNTLIDLEDKGVSLNTLNDSPLKFVRAIVAINLNVTDEEAGLEIQNHLTNGGGLDELLEEITNSLINSGFMKALQNQSE